MMEALIDGHNYNKECHYNSLYGVPAKAVGLSAQTYSTHKRFRLILTPIPVTPAQGHRSKAVVFFLRMICDCSHSVTVFFSAVSSAIAFNLLFPSRRLNTFFRCKDSCAYLCNARVVQSTPMKNLQTYRLVFFGVPLHCCKLLSFSIVKRMYSDSEGTDKKNDGQMMNFKNKKDPSSNEKNR